MRSVGVASYKNSPSFGKRLIPAGPIVLAMGFFDGVHRGHQAVIKRAREIAREKGLPLVVLTYDHAPGIVYRQYKGGFKYLSTVDRKLELLNDLDVDRVYLISFTSSFASLSLSNLLMSIW